ncbi:MAG: GtrA family protein [Spirochaetia bacterium]
MLAVKYTIFALTAMGINLATQKAVLFIYSGSLSLYLAIIAGTGTGLIVKYMLDKRFIFYYKTSGHAENVSRFFLYSFMGVFTTLIFWFSELSAHFIFQTDYAKYIGGALGLTIGYITKYFLDKRFVFIKKEV